VGEGERKEFPSLSPPAPLPRSFACLHLFASSAQSDHLEQARVGPCSNSYRTMKYSPID